MKPAQKRPCRLFAVHPSLLNLEHAFCFSLQLYKIYRFSVKLNLYNENKNKKPGKNQARSIKKLSLLATI